jgi:hypothetical protein
VVDVDTASLERRRRDQGSPPQAQGDDRGRRRRRDRRAREAEPRLLDAVDADLWSRRCRNFELKADVFREARRGDTSRPCCGIVRSLTRLAAQTNRPTR